MSFSTIELATLKMIKEIDKCHAELEEVKQVARDLVDGINEINDCIAEGNISLKTISESFDEMLEGQEIKRIMQKGEKKCQD